METTDSRYILVTEDIFARPNIMIQFTDGAPEDFRKDFLKKFEGERITQRLLAQIKDFENRWRSSRNS